MTDVAHCYCVCVCVYRSGFSLSLSPDRPVAAGTLSVLDISGLEVLQESPKRATTLRHALKRPPASGDFITVTDCTGNRVYLRKNHEQDQQVHTYTDPHTHIKTLKSLFKLKIL